MSTSQTIHESPLGESAALGAHQIKMILAAITEITGFDPLCLEMDDEPKMWEEAKCSPVRYIQ